MPLNPDKFMETLVNDLKPVAPLRQRAGMIRALLALAAGAAVFNLICGLRGDVLTGRPDPMFMISTGLFLVLAIASAWAVIDMARPWVGIARDGWGWTALMAGVLPITALVSASVGWLDGVPQAIDHGGYSCLIMGCLVGMMTAATLVFWLRRGAPSSPRRAGLLAGVASGAAGIVAVSLHCPYNDLMHIGIWHGLSVIAMGLAGLLAGPRLLRW